MADLKEQCICVKFCFKLGRNALEIHEMFKGKKMPQEEQRFLSGFLYSDVGKCQFKIVSIQIIPPQVGQMKTSGSLQNHNEDQ
jgi:hypothetical protein